MSKESIILLLGILVAATAQFLNLPASFENVLFLFAGAAIAILAFLLRRARTRSLFPSSGGQRSETFMQNGIPEAPHS